VRSPSCECSQQQSRTCFRLVVVVVIIAPSHDCRAPPMHCDLRRFSVYMPQRSGENKRVGKPWEEGGKGRCAHAWASSCSVPTSQPVASRRKTRALSGMSSLLAARPRFGPTLLPSTYSSRQSRCCWDCCCVIKLSAETRPDDLATALGPRSTLRRAPFSMLLVS